MSRGTAGIVLIMLAVLGIWLYVKSDVIQKLLGGQPFKSGSGAGLGPGAGGGGSSGADLQASGLAEGGSGAQTGCNGCGGTVYPGGSNEPGSGTGNIGETGTAYGVGLHSPYGYPSYASYPDPLRGYQGDLTEPVATWKYGNILFSSN